MTDTYKLMARVVETKEVARFNLEAGEDINTRLIKEIEKAAEAGSLSKMATRVGLPALSLAGIGEGEGLSGGENTVSVALFAPDGAPLAGRRFRVDGAGNGNFAAIAIDDDVAEETPIGVFASESVAEQVALFWRNGHLILPS
jgi:hypothetical protein